MERSLRKDPAVRAALETFTRRCYCGKDPTRECLSPWRPVLWLVILGVITALTVAFIALVVVTALRAS
jgi:hypothetical protein